MKSIESRTSLAFIAELFVYTRHTPPVSSCFLKLSLLVPEFFFWVERLLGTEAALFNSMMDLELCRFSFSYIFFYN